MNELLGQISIHLYGPLLPKNQIGMKLMAIEDYKLIIKLHGLPIPDNKIGALIELGFNN